MRVTGLQASDFLSFKKLKVDLSAGSLVVTGPNGSGKSNLARILELALTVLEWITRGTEQDHLRIYDDAGYEGSEDFLVRVGIQFDEPDEMALIRAYLQAAVVSAFNLNDPSGTGYYGVDQYWADSFDEASADALGAGSLVIRRVGVLTWPWQLGWEFKVDGRVLLLRLDGSIQARLFGSALKWPTTPAPGEPEIPTVLGLAPPYDLGVLPEHLTLNMLLPAENQSLDFSVRQVSGVIPPGHRRLGDGLGLDLTQRGAHFGHVLWRLLSQSLVLTDNHRLPLRSAYELTELAGPVPLRDGSGAAGELWRWYNGDADDRHRFERANETFARLTGLPLGLRTHTHPESDSSLVIEPMVQVGAAERPITFAGAGIQEALVLATLLNVSSGHVLVLDEPAVNLAPAMQRRLWQLIEASPSQVLVITHSPDLVPPQLTADTALIRLLRNVEGTHLHQPSTSQLGDSGKLTQLMRRGEVRALLFATGVVLCEGDTEVGALATWWSTTKEGAPATTLSSPDDRDVVLLDAGGDKAFRGFTNLLDAFGVPWVIVCDGPALDPDAGLSKQYEGHARFRNPPQGGFSEVAAWWRERGVFTFAAEYGADGTKSGEFEKYLERVDPNVWGAAQAQRRSKVRRAQWFASEIECPDLARDVWRESLVRLSPTH